MFKKLSKLTLAVIIFASTSSVALADGSTWSSVQNSPAEDNNVLGTAYVEKSWLIYEEGGLKASPFVTGAITGDTKGYVWNNKAILRAGGKLNYQAGPVGLTLRSGLVREHLLNTGDSYTKPFLAAEYWVNWGSGTRWPGSSWGVVGNTSPSEKGNVIAMANAKQSFFVQNVGSNGKVTPFIDITVVRDTKGYVWNNKETYGLGVEYIHSVDKGSVNFGAKFQHEVRQGQRDSGAVAFLTYWFPL
jgi:hypothetical protein